MVGVAAVESFVAVHAAQPAKHRDAWVEMSLRKKSAGPESFPFLAAAGRQQPWHIQGKKGDRPGSEC